MRLGKGERELSASGKPLDEVCLLNQRCGKDGMGLDVLSGTGMILVHPMVTAVYSQRVFGN